LLYTKVTQNHNFFLGCDKRILFKWNLFPETPFSLFVWSIIVSGALPSDVDLFQNIVWGIVCLAADCVVLVLFCRVEFCLLLLYCFEDHYNSIIEIQLILVWLLYQSISFVLGDFVIAIVLNQQKNNDFT